MDYRGYKINMSDNFLMYEVNPLSRGSVHLFLRGFFTSIVDAKRRIDLYEDRKEEVDVEDVQRSGSEQIQRRTYNRRKSTNNS